MFEEVKNSVEDAIDITDMFEFGGRSLVMARRFATKKGEEIYIFNLTKGQCFTQLEHEVIIYGIMTYCSTSVISIMTCCTIPLSI